MCKFESFTFYLGELHDDEKLHVFLLSKWHTELASEPKTKTAAELRVRLHWEKVVKWFYDHLFCMNHMTDLPQIFESTDRICGL